MPVNSDWNVSSNWDDGPPNSPTDTAVFGSSATTDVSLSASTDLDGIDYKTGGDAFAVTIGVNFTLNLGGVGISNSSSNTQNFITIASENPNSGRIVFLNSATAGTDVGITNRGPSMVGAVPSGGNTIFANLSSAGSARFTNEGSSASANTVGGYVAFYHSAKAGTAIFDNLAGTASDSYGGFVVFRNSSTAELATMTSRGSTVNGAFMGFVQFADNATAGNSTLTVEGGSGANTFGGYTEFFGNSTAASSTLIAKGGSSGGLGGNIVFREDSTGAMARVELYGNGNLDLSPHNSTGASVGSIEGDGLVYLGTKLLTVGANDLSTTFMGILQDGGESGGTDGSLMKVGNGTLTLAGANTYTGSTTVGAGKLLVNGSASGTTGTVTVFGGATLGGDGMVEGSTTIQSGGILSPGDGLGTLNLDNLSLDNGATAIYQGGDLVRVANSLTLTDGWTLTLETGFQDGGTVTLFQYAATVAIDLTPTFNFAGLGFNPSTALSLVDTGSSIELHGVSVIPEPSSLSFLFVGLVVGTSFRRSRSRPHSLPMN